MTFGELKEETFRRLREVQPDPRYWMEEDVEGALNEGYVELSDVTEWNEKFQVVDILKDRPYYDARTALRSSFLVLGPAFNITTNRWLTPTVPRDLEIGDLRWEQRVAEPEFFMIRGLFHFSYWPWKGIERGSVKQYYVALPAPMSDDEDEPGFNSNLHYGLVEYALFDLFAQDGETDLAWSHWKEYLTYEQQLYGTKQSRNSIPLNRGAAGSDNGF